MKIAKKHKDILYFVGLFIIITLSFFLYSPRFYALLTSDDALNVLMTYYYKFPQDIYCWGQDRGGTIIPLLSQIPHKFFGLSPISSVSVINYFILIIGYIGFSSLFKSRFTKIIFAIIWFLPPIRFIDLIRFPLGIEYSIIGLSIYVINLINFKTRKPILNHLLICFVILLLSVSIWVSDLAIPTILLMGATGLFFLYYRERKFPFKRSILLYILAGTALNYFFITYAKQIANAHVGVYSTFNTWNTIAFELKLLRIDWHRVLTFQNIEPLYSLYIWLFIFFLLFCIISLRKNSITFNSKNQRWFTFFFLDFLMIWCAVYLSKWALVNGMGRWYFVPCYISFSISILLLFDNLKLSFYKHLCAKILLAITVLVGSATTLYDIKNVKPKTFRSKIDINAELLSLGEIGIIGDYWTSYLASAPNPSQIKATPHDRNNNREQFLIDLVLKQPQLYLIRDEWMDSFPDSLVQFGYILVRAGEPFILGGHNICQYIKTKRNHLIPLQDFTLKPAVKVYDDHILISKDSIDLKDNWPFVGPYIEIGVANYMLEYQIEVDNYDQKINIAEFDAVANWGDIVFGKKMLNQNSITEHGGKSYFQFNFRCDKRYQNIEFRIHFYGNADLRINSVKLIEL